MPSKTKSAKALVMQPKFSIKVESDKKNTYNRAKEKSKLNNSLMTQKHD